MGHRQRQQAMLAALQGDGEPAGMPQQSALATLLVQEWAWGNISTPMLQKVAEAACADGARHPHLDKLSAIGSHGRHPGNTHRDLLRLLKAPIVPAALTDWNVWMKLPFMKTAQMSQKFVLPHALFSHIYSHDFGLFEQVFLGGNQDRLVEFWSQVGTTKHYESSHIVTRPDHKTRCIPLGLHGDGVTVTGVGRSWGKQADVYSWTSLLAAGPSKMVIFLIWACYQQNLSVADDKNTMDEFWAMLVWSLKALERGMWPTHDHNGVEISGGPAGSLAGGYYGTMWCLKGDLDYFAKCLHLENANSNTPCMLCQCNKTDTPWTAVNPDTAEWITTMWSEDDWQASHPAVASIFDLPGVGFSCICPDWMHTKHLGVDQYFYGSVLMLLTHEVDGGRLMAGRPDQNLATLWEDMKKAPGTFGDLRLSMFVPSAEHFPVLKGRAAEIRNFGTPLLAAWEKYMSPRNQLHRQIRLALTASVELERILDRNTDRFVLPADEAVLFRKHCFDLAALLSALGHHYHSRGVFLFHFTVKTHYFNALWFVLHRAQPPCGLVLLR